MRANKLFYLHLKSIFTVAIDQSEYNIFESQLNRIFSKQERVIILFDIMKNKTIYPTNRKWRCGD
jgi:hypothetical protein